MNQVRTDSSEKNAPSKTDIAKLGSSTRGKCASNHDCSPLDTMYRLSWDGAMATETVCVVHWLPNRVLCGEPFVSGLCLVLCLRLC